MLFNSIQFLIFFIIVVGLFFSMPHKYRWVLLLIASYLFYMAWKPAYIVLIIFSTMVDYFCGLKMDKLERKKQKKKYLMISLVVNLGMLFIFKYFNFFNYTLDRLLDFVHIQYDPFYTKLLLPMGISFYTFQTLSYSIDVYRGKQKAEKHFGIFALYVSFFPQLVAGPIERSTRLLPQLREKKTFNYDKAEKGLYLMLLGYFKKIVIADRVAVLVGTVFTNPYEFNSLQQLAAVLFFAVQIYCDFSGYSDIARGVASIMGYDLMENFNTPYLSKSIKEFWRRWHISLSSWLKDYLYVPLGGSRVSKVRHYFNLFVTFFVSGLWHGASWHYVLWGSIHGIYLIIGDMTKSIREKIYKAFYLHKIPLLGVVFKIGVTFVLVTIAWIFFVANSVGEAVFVLKSVLHVPNYLGLQLGTSLLSLGLDKYDLYIAFISIALLFIYEVGLNLKLVFFKGATWVKYAVIILVLLGFGYTNANEFIYFQF